MCSIKAYWTRTWADCLAYAKAVQQAAVQAGLPEWQAHQHSFQVNDALFDKPGT